MRAPLALATALLSGCGYHRAGRADLLPKTIHTIAVPAWGNVTTRYRLAERLPAQITREFIQRTRYRVVASAEEADSVLNGAVVNFMSYPTVFDPVTGRAAGIQVVVILQTSLTERATGRVLFTRHSLEFRERYEISVDPKAYFDETGSALDRLAGDVARSLVGAILDNF